MLMNFFLHTFRHGNIFRKHHSTQHVLVRLIEEWKLGIDQGKHVGSILMDLSKAFDCIPHDLLIAKLNAYGFTNRSCKLLYSYLKGRQQCVKINGTHSKFHTLLAGVPQGSILDGKRIDIVSITGINGSCYALHEKKFLEFKMCRKSMGSWGTL